MTEQPIPFDPERLADPHWCSGCGASDWLPDGSCAECGAPPAARPVPDPPTDQPRAERATVRVLEAMGL